MRDKRPRVLKDTAAPSGRASQAHIGVRRKGMRTKRFDYLYSQNRCIYLVNCQLSEERLIAGLSCFAAGLKSGSYDLGDNPREPICQIFIPEGLDKPKAFPIDEKVIFTVTKIYNS